MEDEKLQFILTLKPLSNLNQIVIPIFELSQINTKLSTVIYNIQSNKPTKIKIVIFEKDDVESSNEAQLKQAIENQLKLVNVNVYDYEVYQSENISFKKLIKKISQKGNLLVWSEAEPSEKDTFLDIILEKESEEILSPVIMILKEKVIESEND